MDYAAARFNMVEGQLRTNKITDEGVLEAMRGLPREEFVPTQNRHLAYIDEDLEIANDRFLMEPMIAARLIQLTQIQEKDTVLVVGAGYMAAVAGCMAETVFAVESDKELAESTGKTLTDLAMDNVVVLDGALTDGLAKQGPYNVILFDGSVEEVPAEILAQLAEGGRLAVVLADSASETNGIAHLYVKANGVASSKAIFDANVQPLPGFAKEKGFVF
ncbi:protein-L-isoaspartate O-methyltransferase family protein [Curvivirga aplysinae]|uniref:protein-L-isoaspartate O-methyltransferase family protein n=1 Tax=Curvivirga aplysinae TaxID=2529852 RepID=UPI0012BD460B|nr:protein-L-isoaspartate O-methyltransferase [Curvivirga aplysinae]MTI08394.1 protein-L-isoaspartate O-methyltransferase [Curvivirga aplysinae]